MKKILNVAVFMLVIQLFLPTSIYASNITVTNDAAAEFEDGDTVCANRSYFLETEALYNEIVVVDANTHMVLKVLSSNNGEAEIFFPENASDIELYITPYDANHTLDTESESMMALTVESCGYEEIEGNTNYDAQAPLADVSYENSMITVTNPVGIEDYEIEYQFLGEKTKSGKEVNEIAVTDNYIFQFKESYTQNGESVESYYELEINPTTDSYYVRNVDSFEIKTIKPLDVINEKMLLILLIFVMLLIYVRGKLKREKKLMTKEKAERRRR